MTIPTDPKRIAKGMWWQRAWTLTRGCTHTGQGCAHCWSEAQSAMRSKQRNAPECYRGVTEHGRWNGVVEPLPAALEVPLHVRRPTTFAVWNDLFGEQIDGEFICNAFGVMEECPRHTFVILTKRHKRMRDFATGLRPSSNVILGYSASTQSELEAGLPDLPATPAAVRCLSLEPLLAPIVIPSAVRGPSWWVIAGGESGRDRRPCRDEWLRDIAEQCKSAGVRCFIKQGHDANGRVIPLPLGPDWAQFPEVPHG